MQSEWHFVVSDPKVGLQAEVDTPSGRPYLIDRKGTWVHQDDIAYILDLERNGCECQDGGMVKPAYHLAKATATQVASRPTKE